MTKHPAARQTATTRALSRGSRIIVGTAILLLVAANIAGAPYYTLSVAERVRSPEHVWFRPAGYVGQTAGIIGALIFASLWLYPLRKKLRTAKWAGSLSRWLEVHIALALTLPLLIAVHAAWQFGGVIGLGFHAMMIVWASGIVGRYLYLRIPRSKSGLELTLEEIADNRRSLVTELAATTGLDPAALEKTLRGAPHRSQRPGTLRALGAMISGDFARWRMSRELRRRWRHLPGRPALDDQTLRHAVDLATREMALDQQVQLLRRTQKAFRYWHLLHRPIAVTAALAVAIHIAVVVAVGATWFW